MKISRFLVILTFIIYCIFHAFFMRCSKLNTNSNEKTKINLSASLTDTKKINLSNYHNKAKDKDIALEQNKIIDNNSDSQNKVNSIKLDKEKNYNSDNNLVNFPKELENGFIFASGWVKYFKFNPNIQDKIGDKNDSDLMKNFPVSFTINQEFEKEKKLLNYDDFDSKSSDGLNILEDHVKNKYLFYFVLFKDRLTILSSRKVYF